MTVLSASGPRKHRSENLSEFGALAVKTGAIIYQGSLVNIVESTGRIKAGAAVAGETFVGVAEETKTGNTAGTVVCKFRFWHQEKIAKAAALTKAYTGCTVALADDNTVTTMSGAGTAGVQVRVGELMDLDADGSAWIAIRRYSGKVVP